ncbi:MAG: hypothetical protein KKA36_03630 [Gammaproteobacteria bacterium]|nr:hypothetical protein [Gammaproteobacteria bacterium]MBU2478156.1 hypothetical protein [Gammaproteobacteria bacterium]
MNTHWLKNILAVLAFSVAGAGTICAETSSTMPFTNYGIVDSAIFEGALLISDQTFRLSDNTPVQKLGGKPASLSDLKPGTKVGFNVYGERAPYYILDVWVLPGAFDFSTLEED